MRWARAHPTRTGGGGGWGYLACYLPHKQNGRLFPASRFTLPTFIATSFLHPRSGPGSSAGGRQRRTAPGLLPGPTQAAVPHTR
jgi:hypothetical protein